MDLYADNILDHYRDPRNTGTGNGATITGHADNPTCGDALTVHLWIQEESITKIEWEGVGCAISQAGMSMLSEELEGMKLDAVLAIDKDDIFSLLGVPIGPRRLKCALLCLHTVKNTIRSHKKLEAQSWLETVDIG